MSSALGPLRIAYGATRSSLQSTKQWFSCLLCSKQEIRHSVEGKGSRVFIGFIIIESYSMATPSPHSASAESKDVPSPVSAAGSRPPTALAESAEPRWVYGGNRETEGWQFPQIEAVVADVEV